MTKIKMENGNLNVPDNPTIPFIEGDGIGPDIWNASVKVFDAAVEKAYSGNRKIEWLEVLAGEKAFKETGEWLPDKTIEIFQEYLIGIKGPLTTPVGGGMRSLNVALRQILDLYVCLRPVRWFKGVPSPVKDPHKINMVIFRENTEDIYAGIEYSFDSEDTKKFLEWMSSEFPEKYKKIRFPNSCGIGIKPVSKEGTSRLVSSAFDYMFKNKRKNLTLVHKGNIMKFTEGAFRDWGYEVADSLGAQVLEEGPWRVFPSGEIVKDVIADAFLQQILTRPDEYDVIATLNLNGDYISDALAAQVGGIGIAPGGNLNYLSGHAIFEATHGTAPKYAGQDKVNPGSVILSGELMLRHLGWNEAADLIVKGIEGSIAEKQVTYDFARLIGNVNPISCSGFGSSIIERM